jgi:hypothetical protein
MAYSEGGDKREGRSRETEPEMMAYLQTRSAAGADPVSAEDAAATSYEADEQLDEREMPRREMDQ